MSLHSGCFSTRNLAQPPVTFRRKKISWQDISQTSLSCQSAFHTTNTVVSKSSDDEADELHSKCNYLSRCGFFGTNSFFIFLFPRNEIPAWLVNLLVPMCGSEQALRASVFHSAGRTARPPRSHSWKLHTKHLKKGLNGAFAFLVYGQFRDITYIHITLLPSPPSTTYITSQFRVASSQFFNSYTWLHSTKCVAIDRYRITFRAASWNEHFLETLRSSQLGIDTCFQWDFGKQSICRGDSIASTSLRSLC
ncbi:unnamed protein product [Nyctereutes procyonoides]|uniref:(raccoon dog) hypothetical protein n=1 Tax=Nyctereutes procyonoides TaxID=34880 RepID=A0A811Y928_NYCPR|nr:unnamed protein product [Nyctereutes procyonoides]